MGTVVDLQGSRRRAVEALAGGADRPSLCSFHWDVAGRCREPVGVEVVGHSDVADVKGQAIAPGLMIERYDVRCRRCDACMRARARLWTARAVAEVRASCRTWFGTLTLRPAEQMRFLALARRRAVQQGDDYDALPYNEQFRRRVAQIGPDLGRYLKRVRKESGGRVRVMLVAERHVSGDPHFHFLLHERSWEHPVRKRTLQRQWTLGFSAMKLCDDTGSARYVCKYLSKSAAARVRASKRYGEADTVLTIEAIQGLVQRTTTPLPTGDGGNQVGTNV